ncbi:hypothetical protein [Sphingomonas sp. LT1P40]|uniref:hypothetical protein n=1 Tax=Alteristakelama amylovorans TaxID=3096166 RepID=UPI002FCBFA3B
MLAAICALAIGLMHARGPQALLDDERISGAVGALAGWLTGRTAIRRLDWHRADGVLAADALTPVSARRFLALGATLGLAVVAVAGLAIRPGVLPFLLTGFGGGTALGIVTPFIASPAWSLRCGGGGGTTPLKAIVATQLPFGWSAASGGILLVILAAMGVSGWVGERWAPFALAAGALLPLLMLGRVDHKVVRFLAATGYGAGHSALLHLAAGAAYLVPVALLAGLFDPRAAAIVALIGLGFGCYVALRVWAYRVHSRRSADTILTFSIFGAGLVGMLMPPLVALVIGYLGVTFYRRARSVTWMLP